MAQLVDALPYNPEARGFDSRWVNLRFFFGSILFRPHWGPWSRLSLYQRWVPGVKAAGAYVRLCETGMVFVSFLINFTVFTLHLIETRQQVFMATEFFCSIGIMMRPFDCHQIWGALREKFLYLNFWVEWGVVGVGQGYLTHHSYLAGYVWILARFIAGADIFLSRLVVQTGSGARRWVQRHIPLSWGTGAWS